MKTNNDNKMSMPRHTTDGELIAYLDGELEADSQTDVRKHLESCWDCRKSLTNLQRSIENFLQVRQDTVTPRELPPAGPALELFRERLAAHRTLVDSHSYFRFKLPNLSAIFKNAIRKTPFTNLTPARLPLLMSTAALVLFAIFIVWISIAPQSTVSADEIINKAASREKAWAYQPNKVLHWVVQVDLINHPTLPDGQYLTHFWQNNYPGQMARLVRKYDQTGVLVWAVWVKPDGSSVLFDHFAGDQVRLNPTRAARQEVMRKILREDADRLEPASRQELENLLKEADEQEKDDPSRRYESLANYLLQPPNNTTLEVVNTPEAGKTFRIRNEFAHPTLQGDNIRGVMERYIAADTLKLIRMKSIRYITEGKTAVEDARWTLFEETSIADLQAHDLSDVIANAKRVIRPTPAECLQQRLTIHYKRQGREKVR